MEYVRTDPASGRHLCRCRGCHLAGAAAGMTQHCNDEVWEDPSRNLRLFKVG